MSRRMKEQRGYSLTELLTVVAIIGVITLVTIPAVMQVIPQYRLRAATAQLAAALRMTRQTAITTRNARRVTFDAANARYSMGQATSPTADITTTAGWQGVGDNNRLTPGSPVGSAAAWQTLSGITMSTAGLLNLDCDSSGYVEAVFNKDGTLDDDFNSSCASGGTAKISFITSSTAGSTPQTMTPRIRLHYDSNLIRFNTYYIYISDIGQITTAETKE
jgi:prepilin-type N-terminal cleavage/methylation domain-containing protein